ncbi:MAG: uroporphyrinogen-III decarboxylase-like protein, partial [Spirochaetes bacterium]|nr:uroporphyrinogen-III decarboxylase-like protein [Spirochaetota bacterium]
AFEICGDLIDIVYLSDDMGMQDRPILPLDKWKEFFLYPYSRLIKLIKGYGKKVFYHSDGSAFDILEQMVILGADVINPVQYRCPGMEREKLKKELGSRVVFHGAVENQKIIPFGSPEEVKEEVRDNLKILGSGGGYICAPCHNIQPGTPVENIKALYETVAKEGHLYL